MSERHSLSKTMLSVSKAVTGYKGPRLRLKRRAHPTVFGGKRLQSVLPMRRQKRSRPSTSATESYRTIRHARRLTLHPDTSFITVGPLPIATKVADNVYVGRAFGLPFNEHKRSEVAREHSGAVE